MCLLVHREVSIDVAMQARQLEGEIDVKIAAFAKLCSNLEYGYSKGETGLASDRMLHMKKTEVEELLKRLTDVTGRMAEVLGSATDNRSHTLARHRDILYDYSQEYRRLANVANAAKDRAELLDSGAGNGISKERMDNTLMGEGSTEMLMRERGTIDRSNFALDGVIGQAQQVATSLTQQRQIFDSVNAKVGSLAARYPVVNSLLNAIRRRKNRDSVILASVIALCVLLILIYWVNK